MKPSCIYIHVYHINCVIWWIKIKNVNTPILLFLTQSVVEVIILNLEKKTPFTPEKQYKVQSFHRQGLSNDILSY